MRFRRTRRGIEARVDSLESVVLARCAAELLELLDDGVTEHSDPLAAAVGLAPGPIPRPADPALARLFPDAYGDDDAAAAEFRRYTELDLRAGKREAAAAVLAALPAGGGTLVLDADETQDWLGFLNDVRLVMGTRLGVTEETDLENDHEDPDDPVAQALYLYGWLGWLQESLLSCLLR